MTRKLELLIPKVVPKHREISIVTHSSSDLGSVPACMNEGQKKPYSNNVPVTLVPTTAGNIPEARTCTGDRLGFTTRIFGMFRRCLRYYWVPAAPVYIERGNRVGTGIHSGSPIFSFLLLPADGAFSSPCTTKVECVGNLV